MVRNVVFDIGGVIAEWTPGPWFREHFGEELGPRLQAVAMGGSFWSEHVDRGLMSEEAFFQHQREQYPDLAEALTAAEKIWRGILRPKEDTTELIRRLRAAGYPVYYLSNFPEQTFHYVSGIMPAFGMMDGGVASWEVHTIKPEPEIYRLLLERYGLRPEETVFADDTLVNVEAAEALGIRGWRFDGAAGFEEYLTKELGMKF